MGHSFGGVLVRIAYLMSAGQYKEDSPGSAWWKKVDRIVLFAAPNRGIESKRYAWSERLAIYSPFGRLGRIIRDQLKGSEVITNLRIRWIRFFAKSKLILLTAALAVIMSAITAPAAPLQPVTVQAAKATSTTISQSQLPFTIDPPGTYVLTGDLSYTSGASFGAINIIGPIEGPVVIDLKGFTLTSEVADSIYLKQAFLFGKAPALIRPPSVTGESRTSRTALMTSKCPISRSKTLFLIRMGRVSFSANS